MTHGYLRIYDGPPNAGGTVVWGDFATNRMASTGFTNIYRVAENNIGTLRPIMEIVCETPGLVLNPGTFWVEYTFDGSMASGPWAPPITITGETTTGNALQYDDNTTAWTNFVDGGVGSPKAFPS